MTREVGSVIRQNLSYHFWPHRSPFQVASFCPGETHRLSYALAPREGLKWL